MLVSHGPFSSTFSLSVVVQRHWRLQAVFSPVSSTPTSSVCLCSPRSHLAKRQSGFRPRFRSGASFFAVRVACGREGTSVLRFRRRAASFLSQNKKISGLGHAHVRLFVFLQASPSPQQGISKPLPRQPKSLPPRWRIIVFPKVALIRAFRRPIRVIRKKE